jgi:hypothetical protein
MPDLSKQKKSPVVTFTGEIAQPVRLHYNIRHFQKVLDKLRDLKCVGTNIPKRRFQWHLSHEASDGTLKLTSNQNPADIRVLGFLFVDETEKKMMIRVLSIERAVFALRFFDKYIGKKYMKVTSVDMYNRILSNSVEDEMMIKNSDLLFPAERITIAKVGEILELMEQWKAAGMSQVEMQRAFMEYTELSHKRPVPEIEHFPIYFYEDGIDAVQFGLKLHQIVAFEHFNGNTSFRMKDAVEKLMGVSSKA